MALRALIGLLSACALEPHAPAGQAPAEPVQAEPVHARLPQEPEAFAPSQARVDGTFDAELFSDTATCAECHPAVTAQWRDSPHARASFDNPWYRSAVESIRTEQGFTASRHCGGCHDPLLLLTGAMMTPVTPSTPHAADGVTCLICHSIRSVTADGNGSYTLDTSPVPYPIIGDPASTLAHTARLTPAPLGTPALCGSCHRGFLGPHTGNGSFLSGIDEPGAWRASAWAGNTAAHPSPADLPARGCQGCHMPPEAAAGDEAAGGGAAGGGVVRSHRFPGGHSALAEIAGPEQAGAVRRQQEQAAQLDLWTDGRELWAGVLNRGAGHRLPGGVRDMKDLWVEVEIREAGGAGRIVAVAGTDQERQESETAFLLRTSLVDADGRIEVEHRVQRLAALAWDHTVTPQDAVAVRYALPPLPPGSYRATARLRARRHRIEARAAACRATEAARAAGHPTLDGCREEPITGMASASVGLRLEAGGRLEAEERPTADQVLLRSRALLHLPTEELEQAEADMRAWRPLVSATEAEFLDLLLARVRVRQGRWQEAVAMARGIAAPGLQAAALRVEAEAHAGVWGWAGALAAWQRLAAMQPGDPGTWRELARAAGSLDQQRVALEAARAGLAFAPRDASMLRSQFFALRALQPDDGAGRAGAVTAAEAAWLAAISPEAEDLLRLACDRQQPACARDRQPVPRIRMVAP